LYKLIIFCDFFLFLRKEKKSNNIIKEIYFIYSTLQEKSLEIPRGCFPCFRVCRALFADTDKSIL
jgi:hypothetical protein